MSTTPDYAGLIERLESIPTKWVDGRLGKEAATAIRTLLESSEAPERERSALLSNYETAQANWELALAERDRQYDENVNLIMRVAELEKALEPFAREAAEIAAAIGDDTPFALSGYSELGLTDFTVGHLRTARSLVKGGGDG